MSDFMRNESGINGGKQTILWSKVVVQPHLYILMKFSYSVSKKGVAGLQQVK